MAFTAVYTDPRKISNIQQSQGMTQNDLGGVNYDLKNDVDAPTSASVAAGYDQGISSLATLPTMISSIYSRLKAAGRDSDAWLLRDATERFANAGKSLGVNAFSRASALNDLQGRLTAAANTREVGISQQEISELSNIQKELSRLGAEKASAVFNKQMELANYRDKKIATTPVFVNGGTSSRSITNPTMPSVSNPVASNSGVQPLIQSTPYNSTAADAWKKKMQAESDMRNGLTEKVNAINSNSGVGIYAPNYVDAAMGNLKFLRAATDYLGRPISNTPTNQTQTWNS